MPTSVAAVTRQDRLPPYRRPAADVIAALGSDARRGLSAEEARVRLERHGLNELPVPAPVPAWRRFLAQFKDLLTTLLLVATAVSAVVWWIERDSPIPYEALTILAIVFLNGVLGFVQESRAEQAVAALRAMSAPTARVVRDAEQATVATVELVPARPSRTRHIILRESRPYSPGARLRWRATARVAARCRSRPMRPRKRHGAPWALETTHDDEGPRRKGAKR